MQRLWREGGLGLAALAIACHSAAAQPAATAVSAAADTPDGKPRKRGYVHAAETGTRPASFPHRIWAACDFEARTPDYGWFGQAQTTNIVTYPGNTTAIAAQPFKSFPGLVAGINPVPGPRMGPGDDYLYARYFLKGTNVARFQHFNLSQADNRNVLVDGLTQGVWTELTLNLSRDAKRNDGSAKPFIAGDRMDDLKVMVGKAAGAEPCELLLDDLIFFSIDPSLPPEPEPFPNRVLWHDAFDTGTTKPEDCAKYHPGTYELVSQSLPAGSFWSAVKAVAHPKTGAPWIRLQIAPVRSVGPHTKLRFRYHLTGADTLRVQIFDCTDQDNRFVRLRNLRQNAWQFAYVDFTREGQRNDGKATPFATGHTVDDLFFFVEPPTGRAQLLVDEVTLFDAGANRAPVCRCGATHESRANLCGTDMQNKTAGAGVLCPLAAALLAASNPITKAAIAYDPLAVSTQSVPPTVELTVHDAQRDRDIPLHVYLPATTNPAPVVLFSHGLGGSNLNSAYLGRHWSARGYVAVFLQHQGSDTSVWKEQPLLDRMAAMRQAANAANFFLRVKDVSAVLDQLERWNGANGHVLTRRLDLTRIGMSGHSFGAVTTQAVSGQAYRRIGAPLTDPRIKAAIAFSPSSARDGVAPATAFGHVKIPWMLMTGTKDVSPIGGQDAESRQDVFPALPPGGKYELVLYDAAHLAFSDRPLGNATHRNPNHHRVILALSTAFWDAWLCDDPGAKTWLDGDGPSTVLEKDDRWQRK